MQECFANVRNQTLLTAEIAKKIRKGRREKQYLKIDL